MFSEVSDHVICCYLTGFEQALQPCAVFVARDLQGSMLQGYLDGLAYRAADDAEGARRPSIDLMLRETASAPATSS